MIIPMKALLTLLCSLTLIAGCGSRSSLAMPNGVIRALSPIRQLPDATAQGSQTGSGSSSSSQVTDDTPASQSGSRPSSRATDAPDTAPAQPAPASQPKASGKALQVKLYRSFGSDGQIHVRGRVMEPEEHKPFNEDDSSLTNLLRNLGDSTVDEVPGIRVDLTLNGKVVRLVSDKEGMLMTSTKLFGTLEPGLHTLTAVIAPGQKVWSALSETRIVVQPEADETLGYVSDIDDTIKVSEVTNKLVAAGKLLFGNPKTSHMIPGTSTLYQILEAHDGKTDGDFHYLSGSPLNLSDTLYGFLDGNQYPRGSVDLKKWGFSKGDDNPIQQQDYKQEKLRLLFKTYPKRVYLLFGDSGEKDPEIYRQIATEFPGRVKGIFINNVTEGKQSDARFQGVQLTNNAGEAAAILHKAGLLKAEEVAQVKAAL